VALNPYDEALDQLDDQTPTPSANPYLAILDQQDRARTARLRLNLAAAEDQPPERAAEIRRLAERTGLPRNLIDRNFDAIRRRAKLADTPYTQMLRETPALAGWLEDPENAAVASDDVDALLRLEQTVTFGAAIMRGIDQIQGLTYSALEATAQAIGSERLEAVGRAGRERNRAEIEAAGPRASLLALRSPWDLVQWAKETIGEQVPIMGTMLAGSATGAAVGSVVPGVGTTVGAVIGAFLPALAYGVGEVQQTLKDIDPDADVPAAAFIGGSAIAAFDTILPGRIGGRLVATFGRETAEAIARRALLAPVKTSLLRAGARGMATEGITEAIQEGIEAVAGALGTDTAVPADTWRQMIEAGAAGALVGGLAAGGEATVSRRHVAQQRAVGEQQRAIFDALAKGVADSQLVKRLPEAAQAFLAQATKDGPLETVYAPTDTWATYWQGQGIDPAAVAAELTGNPDALAEATSAGTDLAIPTAAYAVKVAVTPHHGFFANELRLDPALMNAREAAAFEAQTEVAAAPAAAAAPSPIVEAIREQLAPLGFDESAIEAYAAVHEAFFGRQAERAAGGAVTIDPVELFERYGLRIERPDLERLRRMVPPAGAPAATGAASAGPAAAAPAAGPGLPAEFVPVGEEPAPVGTAAATAAQQEALRSALAEAERIAAAQGRSLTDEERAAVQARALEPVAPGAEAAMADAARGRVRPGEPTSGKEGPVDRATAEGQTETDDLARANRPSEGAGPGGLPAFRGVEASPPPARGESARQFAVRRDAHHQAVVASVLDAARAVDPAVDPDRIHADVESLLEALESLDEEWRASGQNPRRLLEQIAAYGGISLEAEEGGYAGELRWIRESSAFGPFGSFAGVRGVFRQARRLQNLGTYRTGTSLDDMLGQLRQDPEFQYLEDINDLLAAIEDIARLEQAGPAGRVLPGTSELGRLGFHPYEAWWLTSTERAAMLAAETPAAAEPQFDVTELEQGAYHGSPHEFDRFSLQAIGSGEGAQSYGWGLYFASEREVAEQYRRRLSAETPGRTYKVEIPEDEDYLDWDRPLSQQSPKIQRTLEALGFTWQPLRVPSLKQALRMFDTLRVQRAAAEDVGVRDTLREGLHYASTGDEVAFRQWFYRHSPTLTGKDRAGDVTGEQAYEELAQRLANERTGSGLDPYISWRMGKELASKALNAHGVAGIRYLDQFSRAKGDGTSNFVVFDDALVQITEYSQSGGTPSEPIAMLTGTELGDGLADLKTLRGAADAYYRRELQQGLRSVERPGFGVVAFTGAGRHKVLSSSANPDTLRLLPAVPSIIRAGRYVGSVAPAKGHRRKVRAYHFFAGPVRLGDRVLDAGVTVFEDVNGNKFYNVTANAEALWKERQARSEPGVQAPGIEPAEGDEDITLDQSIGPAAPGVNVVLLRERARIAEDEPYQADLFGEPLPPPPGPAAQPVVELPAAALQRDDVEGEFATRTQLVTEHTFQLHAPTVLTPQDAATAISTLARGAQERFDALVTDAEGTPLGIVGSFKGSVDESHVHPSVLVAEAFRIQGAAAIWFVHNHPSGSPGLSDPDIRIAAQLADLFRGTEIAVKGFLTVGVDEQGRGRFQALDPTTGARAEGAMGRRRRGPRVPVLERELVTTGKLAGVLSGPQDAVGVVPGLARGQFGAALLDARNQPIGFLPIDPAEAAQLRTAGRLDALYRAISIGNPAGVILHSPEGTEAAALNLANAFHAAKVPVLDIVEASPRGPVSRRAVAGDYGFGTGFTGRFEQARRGAIRFGPDRRFTIQLFAQADLSTFLHESAHFFFEVFADLADRVRTADPAGLTAEQRQMLADYDAILAFMGVEGRDAVTREHHEQFARAFEAYLLDGKAPALTLRAAFARFRAWLLGIYRSLRGLNVTLSDQVRQVFDRLLAGEDAIAEAQAEGVRPLFATAEQAGMTEREFGLYRGQLERAHDAAREALDRRLMAEVQREREAAWKARRDEIEAEVSAEVYARPEYRALTAIQRGTQPDGEPLEEGLEPQPMRLSRQVIVNRYGEAFLRTLPPFTYLRTGGFDPDTVGELFGFSSGDALLQALAAARPMRALIREQVEARMVREHGSLLLDGSVHDLARAAVANEDRDQVVRAELRALANLKRTVGPHVRAERQAGAVALAAERKERAYERRWLEAEARLRIAIAEGRQQVEIDRLQAEINSLKAKARGGPAAIRAALPPQGAIRATARERIARTRIRDIRPQQFWSAAAQASRRAVEAAARQDFDAAIAAKQQELLSLALYREGVNALDEVDRRVARAKDLARPKVRQRLGLAGESYLDQIDGILDRYEFARVSEKALERRASIVKWAAAIEGEGLPVDLPDEVLDEARRVNYRNLTVEALIGVTDGIEHIVHLARLKNRLLKAGAARELDRVAADLVQSITANRRRRRPADRPRDRRPAEQRRRAVESFFAGHRKISSLAYELDGFTEGGPVWEALIRPLNEAGAQEAGMLADATRALHALIDRAYPKGTKHTLYTRFEVPAIGRSLSKIERLMVALYWGNVEGRNRVLENEGWTTAQVEAVLDGLDARDWRFVQDVWDYLESFWPQIAEKEQRVSGVAPQKVEALPIQTRFGEMRGGYVPLRYDDRESAAAGAHSDLEAGLAHVQAAYLRSTTNRGHTKARRARVNRRLRLRLDLGVIFEHVQQVVHDLSHHEALIDVGRVLGHADVQAAIYETQGDIVYRVFQNTLRDIAVGETAGAAGVERAFHHVRVGTTAAMLGYNLTTAAFQVLGLTQSMQRVGPKWVMKGVSRFVRDAATMENTARWIRDRSEMMRTRFLTQQRDVRDALRDLGVHSGQFSGWVEDLLATVTWNTVTKQRIVESYFWFIQVMQRLVDIPTWLGAYEKAMAAGRDEPTAIAMADQAVLDTQGGGQIKDLAAVQRGGEWQKLWMTFGSFFNTTYNLAVETKRRTRWAKPLSVPRLGVDYLLLFIVPASLSVFLRRALRGEEDDEDLAEELIRENLAYLMGILVGLRELGGVAQGFAGYEGPAGSRVFASAGRAAKQTEQVVREVAETGAAEETLDEPFFRALTETAGILFHLPTLQMWRTAAGMSAWIEGQSETPVSLIGGPPREER